jgi:hypothetical protein
MKQIKEFLIEFSFEGYEIRVWVDPEESNDSMLTLWRRYTECLDKIPEWELSVEVIAQTLFKIIEVSAIQVCREDIYDVKCSIVLYKNWP